MRTLELTREERREARHVDGVADRQTHYGCFIHLTDGTIQEIAAATEIRLTNTDVLVTIGDITVERIPRERVYFATPEPGAAPPVLF